MTPQDHAMLSIEKRWYRTQAAKENDITEEMGMSAVRYYMQLNRLLDNPEALAAEPVLIKRLRRIRDSRAALRRAG